jgi:hypothetical protein
MIKITMAADGLSIRRKDAGDLVKTLNADYEAIMEGLPIKRSTAKLLIDGAKDGHRNGVFETLRQLGIKLVDHD